MSDVVDELRAELERQRKNDHTELYGECIMIIRGHLESAGITAAFADDAAAIAAGQIKGLRAMLRAVERQGLKVAGPWIAYGRPDGKSARTRLDADGNKVSDVVEVHNQWVVDEPSGLSPLIADWYVSDVAAQDAADTALVADGWVLA